MKKVIPGLICLLLISSCGFETPESITIKGKPGLYVPLSLKQDDILENLISPEKIKDMLNTSSGKDKDMEIIDIVNKDNPQVRTYLVEYKLDSIPLDLQKYMHEAIDYTEPYTIPVVPDQITGTTYYIDEKGESHTNESETTNSPFLKIPLHDMKKFVKEVRRDSGKKFGLEITVDDSKLTQSQQQEQLRKLGSYLQLKIPAIGFNTYRSGVLDSPDNPTKLQFVNAESTSFFPRKDLINGELWIYASISGPCPGTINPAIVCEWKEAVIDTTEGNSIHDEYPVGENSLSKLFEFKKVSGYVYIYGTNISNKINMTYDIGSGPSGRELKVIPNLPDFNAGNLDPASFDDNKGPLDMTELFNKTDGKLEVDISIPELTITNDNSDKPKTIESILCVLIPLDLKVSGKVPDEAIVDGVKINNNYVSLLDLVDELNGDGTGDLFGREEYGDNNIIKNIDYIDIHLKKIDITVTDKNRLAVLIKNNGVYKLLKFETSSPTIHFDEKSINPLFNPVFTVLVKKDEKGNQPVTYETFGSFKILRPVTSKFDIKLDVKAKVAFEYNLKL